MFIYSQWTAAIGCKLHISLLRAWSDNDWRGPDCTFCRLNRVWFLLLSFIGSMRWKTERAKSEEWKEGDWEDSGGSNGHRRFYQWTQLQWIISPTPFLAGTATSNSAFWMKLFTVLDGGMRGGWSSGSLSASALVWHWCLELQSFLFGFFFIVEAQMTLPSSSSSLDFHLR